MRERERERETQTETERQTEIERDPGQIRSVNAMRIN